MTLHLTMLTPNYVLQVSDRLISRGDTGATHPLANKNVVFLARDGIVTIAYTGLAFIDHVPTDTWIACKLAGVDHSDYRDGGRGILMRGLAQDSWPTVDRAVELLREETEAAFASLHRHLVMPHRIALAGWQSLGKRFLPIHWIIENSGDEPRRFAKASEDRYLYYDKQSESRLYALPEERLSHDEAADIFQGGVPAEPGACKAALVESVRRVASRTKKSVGPDCMSILIPNPQSAKECHVSYEPVIEGRALLVGGGDRIEVPAAFTPWFVGPQLHAPPLMLMGGGGHIPFDLGEYKLIGSAPPIPNDVRLPSGARILSWMTVQERPIDPNLGRRRRKRRSRGSDT